MALRRAAPWATATKNVKKPLGEKEQTFRKSKMLLGPKANFFDFLNVHSFSPVIF